jgi:DNA-binding LacI/PurR family transcriptional regulator
MSAPVRIRSLARDLGLSSATVSEALRCSPHVKLATRQRVLKVAAAGDHRNPLARTMNEIFRVELPSSIRPQG